MSSDSEEFVIDLDEAARAIREVRTVRELEPLMVTLNRFIYTSRVSLWDTLSTIVDLAKDRIDTITSLTDLGEYSGPFVKHTRSATYPCVRYNRNGKNA